MRHRYRSLFQTYVGAVSLFLLYIGVDAMRQHDRWAMGDWIINYAGGFVRRGLIGQVALVLSHLPPHIPLYLWVFVLQLLCYSAMLGTVVYLVRKLAWTFWMVVLLYSPASLLFPVLDPTSAFRKEILFLAFLGAIIVALRCIRVPDIWLSAFITIAMVLLVLSHEGMLFYYPYIVCAVALLLRDPRRSFLICLPGAVTGIIAFVAATHNPGTFPIVSAICTSLGEHDLSAEPCSGAIVYMTRSPATARHDVITAIAYWHLDVVMPFFITMSLLPVIIGLRALWKETKIRYEWWIFVCCASLSWLATIGLFIYGFDWNRWIYVHVFSSLLLMLLIEHRRQELTVVKQQALFKDGSRYKFATILFALLLTCTWQLSFYHHFPLPGDTVAVYLRDRIHHRPLHKELNWNPREAH